MALRRYRPRSCPACGEKGSACGGHSSFYEPADMASFVRRISRAMVRRAIESGDTEVLVAIRAMRAELDRAELEAARALYYGSPDPANPLPEARSWGYSWTDLAHELGVSRQAVMKRYADNRLVSQNRSHDTEETAAAS